MADTNITGVKISDLPAANAVTDQHLFAVADKTTGFAYKATQEQLMLSIGTNGFKSAIPTTNPVGAVDGDVYLPTVVGTYTNFKNQSAVALAFAVTDGIVYFVYNGTYWTKIASTTDLTNYVQKSTLKNDFLAVAVKTVGLDGAMSKTFKDLIDTRTLYGSYALQTLTTESGYVDATNGNLVVQVDYLRCVSIVVSPGQKLKFTASNSVAAGWAGYDKNGVYIATLDSYGLPYGHLWSNTRKSALDGTAVAQTRVVYTDQEITIPFGCYLVKGCSATAGVAPTSPLIASLETVDGTSSSIKQKIDKNTKDVSTNKQLIDGSTLYGSYALQTLTMESGYVNAQTGALVANTSWHRCISISVVPGQKLKFTAVHYIDYGIAGYDAAGNFLAELDSYGLPYGHLWSNSRYAVLTGTIPINARNLFTDIEVSIPANCYLIKASSGNTGSAPNQALILSLEVYGTGSITTKDKIAGNQTDIANLKNQDSGNKWVAQTLTLTTNSNIIANTGVINNTSNWNRTQMIKVVPGQRIRLTMSNSVTYGCSAYDINNVFLPTLDAYNLPVGNLWSKQRWTAMTGMTHPDANTAFVGLVLTAPAGCYGIRISSVMNTGTEQYWQPPVVELEVADTAVKTIKNQVVDNSTDIENIKKQLLTVTDLTLTKSATGAVSTVTGVVNTGTTWETNDLITVREPNEVGKDIYVYYTGVCTGSRSNQYSPSGLAGYDAAGVFLSTLDSFGIPEGALWDYDRFVQNGFKPDRTKNSGQTFAWTDVLVKIPSNCYKVRGQGTITNAVIGTFPLKLKKAVYNPANSINTSTNAASIDTVYIDNVAANVIGWSQTAGNPNTARFTFVHFGDIHYYSSNYAVNHDELNAFANDSLAASKINAILCTGDISEGIAGRGKTATMNETTDFSNRFLNSLTPVMYCPGNHDDNVNFDGAGLLSKANVLNNAITRAELYAKFNGAIKTKYGLLQTVTDKLYSYQDFAEYQIRVIALDRYEDPLVDDGSGQNMLRYKNAAHAGHWYSQAQLDWLQTTLASIPAGWSLLVMTHGSLDFSTTDFATLTALQGTAFIPTIIDAWIRGGTYNHSYTHPVYADMNTTKNFNFTTRGAGKFITYIAGHTHCTGWSFVPAFPTQRTIVVSCTFTGGMDDGTTHKVWGQARSSLTIELRNAFHIISVDTTNRKLFLTFFGAHKDLSGNVTTDSIVLPY